MQKRLPAQEGFTIVELVITLIIAALATILIGTMYASATRLSDRSTDILTANSLAYSKLQKYEIKKYVDIPVVSGGVSPFIEDFSAEVPTSLPAPREGKVFINQQTTNMKYILVRVKYGSGAQERVVEYGDLIQKGGLGR